MSIIYKIKSRCVTYARLFSVNWFIILFGVAMIYGATYINNADIRTIFITIGATIITLPIVLQYQIGVMSANSAILTACEKAGIESIFVSRHDDSLNLPKAIEDAAAKEEKEIFLLGVAFPSFLHPNTPHTASVIDKLYRPSLKLRIIVLDPDSTAAIERSELEIGSSTQHDIRETLEKNIVSIAHVRISRAIKLLEKNPDFKTQLHYFMNSTIDSDSIVKSIADLIHIEVKLQHQHPPIVFIVGFSHTLFTEQYHLGRPKKIVRPKGCIGKYLPVLQYERNSNGYIFLREHFEYMFRNGRDYTNKIIHDALLDYRKESLLCNDSDE